MEKSRKKELREQYENRRPDMGVATWRCGDEIWVTTTTDAASDYNSTRFQLSLGSWPGKDLQQAYNAAPDGFVWTLEKSLEYDDRSDDHREDLDLLLMKFMKEHPNAKPMKPARKNRS